MTELSGTLEGVGLPAIIRFLTGLEKTGCLRIVLDDWQGEIVFEAGQLTDASLGARHGLSALDALIEVLPGGSFAFDTSGRRDGARSIDLSPEALQTHLDTLVARIVGGAPSLPSVDSVPELIAQAEPDSAEEPLPLDRGKLQTLLAVDGQRSVRQIVAYRGTFDALWQLGNLAEVGLVRLASTGSAQPPLTEPSPVRDASPVAAPQAIGHCPKLGFEDDPGNSFGRPTRLHRCFAAATPLPLSLDQQRELCLSDQFATCPRIATVVRGVATPAPGSSANARGHTVGEQSAAAAVQPEAEDPRIVRLPFAGRNPAVARAGAAERAAAGGSEPTQLRSPGFSPRPGDPPRPTPLRARIDRATTAAAASTVPVAGAPPVPAAAEPPAAPSHEPRPSHSATARMSLEEPWIARLGGVPVRLIAIGAVALIALAAIAYVVVPQLGDWVGDDSSDLSAFPNASAVAAGTPVAQVAPRPTPAQSAATAAAATGTDALAEPTPLPEPTVAAVEPTVASQPAAPATLLDERFTNNALNWPSNAQGTTWLTSGSYRLIPRQATKFVAVGVPLPDVLKDVVVSATFRKLAGSEDGGGFGIIVRDQSPTPLDGVNQGGQYYVLEVGDKGEVGMWRRDVDHWVDLLPWQHADAVHPGTASNDLVVSAIGNRLTLSVNGTQVATRTDNTLTSGHVGLLAGGDGNQIAVDHLTVQTP